MTTTSSSFVRASRCATVLAGLVLLGAALAACGSSSPTAATTTTSATGTSAATTAAAAGSSSLNKIEALSSSVKAAEKATFKSVYTITNAGMTQTVTIEQSPPKSVFSSKGGSVIDTGTATYYCSTSTTPATCLSEGASNPLASLTAIFSPATVLAGLRAAQAEAAAHAAGYNVSFSSGSYAGQSTSCASLSGAGNTVKYCVTKQGILAYVSSANNTFALTSFSSSPPASDFALPAGATVETIPTGLPSAP